MEIQTLYSKMSFSVCWPLFLGLNMSTFFWCYPILMKEHMCLFFMGSLSLPTEGIYCYWFPKLIRCIVLSNKSFFLTMHALKTGLPSWQAEIKRSQLYDPGESVRMFKVIQNNLFLGNDFFYLFSCYTPQVHAAKTLFSKVTCPFLQHIGHISVLLIGSHGITPNFLDRRIHSALVYQRLWEADLHRVLTLPQWWDWWSQLQLASSISPLWLPRVILSELYK